MKKITSEDIVEIHKVVEQKSAVEPGIRDAAMIDSAISAAFQSAFGQDAFPTDLDKIARLGLGLMKNHPFIDGNKRTALGVILSALQVNGYPLPSSGDILKLISGAASDTTSGWEELLRSFTDKLKEMVGGNKQETNKQETKPRSEESLRPFYEFLYDYLDQGMGFVFEDKPDAFEDALRYYGFSGDLLQDKLDNADEGEIREFIVNHYVDTAPEGYEGNLENLKSVIDADEDPDSYAQGLSLLDKAFGHQKNEAGESEDGDGQCICESEGGQQFVIRDMTEYARESADAVEATRKKSQGWQDKVLGMYSKYAKPTPLTPDQVLEYKEADTKGEMLESLEGSDDLQGIVKFLIEDENEAVDGYDKAIKAFNAATLPAPDREHIVSELQHIKEEELEHIRELEEVLQYVPGSYVPGEQAVIAADAEDEASKEEAEEGEEPSAPEGQGAGKEK